jgi:hypothetical protein
VGDRGVPVLPPPPPPLLLVMLPTTTVPPTTLPAQDTSVRDLYECLPAQKERFKLSSKTNFGMLELKRFRKTVLCSLGQMDILVITDIKIYILVNSSSAADWLPRKSNLG